MRTRPTSTIMRLAFAVLFAVMSVVPVPLRALGLPDPVRHVHAAPALGAAHHHAAHRAAHHDHGGRGDRLAAMPPSADVPGTRPPAEGAIPCHAAPCCIAVTQSAPAAPATVLLLLGRLAVPPSRTIVAVAADPATPPPRLRG